MIKVRSVHLVNYCGYLDTLFDFSTPDGGVKDFAVFFGPNGIGKSTCLDAIRMAANPNAFRLGGKHDVLMRKFIHDQEYIPHVDAVQTISKIKNNMEIAVTFTTPEGDKRVVLNNDGLVFNELPASSQRNGYAFFADADHPISTQKFLLAAEQARTFLEFCEEVYGYECILASPVKSQGIGFYTDFIIRKGEVKVHFKRMSAGERKIATLVSDLCQPMNTGGRDIILVDNVEMHVYFKRHTRMVDKLRSCFPGKQIITTSHSSVVIEHVEPEFHYDLEQYRPDYKLFEAPEEEPVFQQTSESLSPSQIIIAGSYTQGDD